MTELLEQLKQLPELPSWMGNFDAIFETGGYVEIAEIPSLYP